MSRTRTRDLKALGTSGSRTIRVTNMSATTGVTIAGAFYSPGQTRDIVFPQDTGVVNNREITGSKDNITDEPHGVGAYNEVNHTKEEWNYQLQAGFATTLMLTKSGVPYRVQYLAGVEGASVCHQNNGVDAGSYPPLSSTATLKALAANSMRPGEPPVGADLLQFIGELTDFRGLLENIGKRLLKLPSAIANLLLNVSPRKRARRYEQAWKSLTLASIISTGVSADLAWKLVWGPLIKDLKKIRRAVYDLDRAYRRVLAAKPFVVRGYAQASSSATPMDYGSSTMGGFVRSFRTKQLEVRTWAMVQHTSPDLKRRDFMYHYLGLYPRVSVAWELMPLSFVVDWFVDIGRWLRQFEQSPVQLPFKVIQSGYSVKSTVTHADIWIWNLHSDLTGGATIPGVTGGYQKVQYQRLRDSLIFNSSAIEPLQFGLPSLGQLGTLGELVFLKFRETIDLGRH